MKKLVSWFFATLTLVMVVAVVMSTGKVVAYFLPPDITPFWMATVTALALALVVAVSSEVAARIIIICLDIEKMIDEVWEEEETAEKGVQPPLY